MKVLISTPRQYHSIDLANELSSRSHLVYLLSLSSSKLAFFFKRNKGKIISDSVKLRGGIVVAFLWYVNFFGDRFLYFIFDVLTIIHLLLLRPDVFIVWSGFTNYSVHLAKLINSKVLIERGSTQIEYQNTLLVQLGLEPMPKWLLLRELRNYKYCDYIMIPSKFVLDSFKDHRGKCKLIPYGVEPLIDDATSVNINSLDNEMISILYVGSYSIRKGIDRIKEFLFECTKRYLIVNFVHIGDSNGFEISIKGVSVVDHGFVPELSIPNIIKKYKFHVAIQLSYEEGLSRVLAEYLRFSIPIIATESTGIDGLFNCKPLIFINNVQCLDELENSYSSLLSSAKDSKNKINTMSWAVYGKQYSEFLDEIISC